MARRQVLQTQVDACARLAADNAATPIARLILASVAFALSSKKLT